MSTKQVYSLTTPNLVEIEAIAIKRVASNKHFDTWLMYSQNRLFTIDEYDGLDGEHYQWKTMICDYCIIPEAAAIIKNCMKEDNHSIVKLHLI